MKRFCFSVIFVLVIFGSLFAQEDWAEFRWPEQRTIISASGIVTSNSGENILFRDNWERLIPMLAWEEVTDYNLASTRLLPLYEYDRTPRAITVKQVIETCLTSAGSYNNRYFINFWHDFYNNQHLYIVSYIFAPKGSRTTALKSRAFLSTIGPPREHFGFDQSIARFLLEAVKNLNCGL